MSKYNSRNIEVGFENCFIGNWTMTGVVNTLHKCK